ncbi:hypothetical protein CPAST_c07670 [Clostridium pasteurianum DSM 525 = ATCC 6013]|uniref:Uncharacterized protein n=1 Tax=Clostridium pasteurianum DSM 525 = ATCC 6013 TaxID=1262449 RepID=A0A0H3J278_CLOPA|nr:hypothetical protein [Clostridium pasteurianum]AJA46867.1 hypothetical protein CPAST_c07670 [Clostridium pasteurianum DSM 525 = ATCC 6013]AJA50855.1 hypothetical protein CLPA_c07670 [Clostridium pasteurianum DSM 525 = ATCC 6013]AOZ74253.1 hypothetical protein AQ983_03695 [Clostridium pasteurianum DSM 525 = ATCC 6013]AOZ78051.1 hypothetical protein AQ984_03695 [Clostridium pasteurianum]ELP58521.1 hypothetical protein F502_13605 [Clostridium pasteurianum DSM 525 = ATCC 6013]
MLKSNEQITFSGDVLIKALREIELILISLHKMGSYYGIMHEEGKDLDNREYEKETTRFIDEWRVTHRLAMLRSILSGKFDDTLGDDDMDDLERAMEDLKYWSAPGDKSPGKIGK